MGEALAPRPMTEHEAAPAAAAAATADGADGLRSLLHEVVVLELKRSTAEVNRLEVPTRPPGARGDVVGRTRCQPGRMAGEGRRGVADTRATAPARDHVSPAERVGGAKARQLVTGRNG